MNELILSKSSSESDLKRYFTAVLELSHNDNMFPINLDEVWPLVYAERGVAVRALRKNFFENEDFISFDQNVKREKGSSVKTDYFLSLSCLEYFIARKVRPVFEVYRQVFHKTAKSLMPSYQIEDPVKRAERWIEEQRQITALKEQNNHLLQENIARQNVINVQQGEIEELTPKGRIYDQVITSPNDGCTFTTRQVAQEIGMTDRKLFAVLLSLNVIYKQSDTYMICAEYLRWGLHKMTSYAVNPEKGLVRTYLKWTNRGRAYIHALHDTQWDKRRAYHLLKKGNELVTV